MKRIWILGMGLLLMVLTACSAKETPPREKPLVIVGIGPMKEWVETVAGDTVDVEVMIPPGNSPANYEPSTKQLLMLEEMDRYFAMGVGAETEGFLQRIYPEPDSKVIQLYQEVGKAMPDRMMEAHVHEDGQEDEHEGEQEEGHEEEHVGRDPHIWLSIPRAIVMVDRITEELTAINPDQAENYKREAEAYIQKLEALHGDLQAEFGQKDKHAFLLFHPSLGYFADEYGLTMMAIEEGGKAATPTHLIEVIDQAKAAGITTVFYQSEFDENQARTIAQELDGDLVSLSILGENYLESMRRIGDALISSMK